MFAYNVFLNWLDCFWFCCLSFLWILGIMNKLLATNIVKGSKGAKVEVLSKYYIWHMSILCWYIFFIFTFFRPILQLCVIYIYTSQFISFILCIDVLNDIKMKTFVKDTFSKFIIFMIKRMFGPNAFNCFFKWISPISVNFFFIINNKILYNFEDKQCTFNKKRGYLDY